MAQMRRPDQGQRSGSDSRWEEAPYADRQSNRSRSANNRSASHRKRRRRRRKRHPIRNFVIGFLFLILLALGILLIIVINVFRVKEIDITGNVLTSEEEILDWIGEDSKTENSLYLTWKLDQEDLEKPPAIENVAVTLESPTKVQVKVQEKECLGCLDYQDKYLYLDDTGMAVAVNDSILESTYYLMGFSFEPEQVVIGEVLPVSDPAVFDELKEVEELLKENDLFPDLISVDGLDLTLQFGGIRAQLGSSDFQVKILQIPPILERMEEEYNGQTGVLHLENYTSSDSTVRFVPDTALEE